MFAALLLKRHSILRVLLGAFSVGVLFVLRKKCIDQYSDQTPIIGRIMNLPCDHHPKRASCDALSTQRC